MQSVAAAAMAFLPCPGGRAEFAVELLIEYRM
jgi:hypothetical protein